ncbi:MAG: cobalt ECF transporter T component CbiQ [Candidatus Omnitrophica bacterium]|nr:cobalt ECF transporter T component CbiQ [Candidatus Omnitrophota bacterium]MBU1929275.1 cobalt ECF transporter T component CbiQ [Candidatus Omnitrophota bacterium]
MSKNNKFIERSIVGALSFLRESVFGDEYASRKGLLQLLDPRVKVFTFLLFIIQVILIRNIFVLSCLYGICLILALISKINLWFFLKRTWIFIPLFSLFIAVPALFSIISPGEPLFKFNIIWFKLVITRQGLSAAILFVLRVITSVSFATLLSISTKHFELLKVLRFLKVPQIFVITLGMCYRYVYLFVEMIENTYMAIKSRVGARIHYRQGERIVAWNIGLLWQRSYRLNEDVYKAMLSRGYKGEPYLLDDFKSGLKDWFWVFFILLISAGALYFNYRSDI